MTDREPQQRRRQALAASVADLMLAEGLEFGLRGVADRLGTSGRMLLYYFTTRDELVAAALDEVSARLARLLAARSAGPRLSPAGFLAEVLQGTRDPEIGPYMRLWTEIVARAARGESPYRDLAPRVVAGWIAWIDSRLTPARAAEPPGRAAALLALVEGLFLLEQAAPGSTEGAAHFLGQRLAERGGEAPSRGDRAG